MRIGPGSLAITEFQSCEKKSAAWTVARPECPAPFKLSMVLSECSGLMSQPIKRAPGNDSAAASKNAPTPHVGSTTVDAGMPSRASNWQTSRASPSGV